MTELTLCIESQELKSRLRAAALLMQANVHELSLSELLMKRNLPAHWVLVDHGLEELGGLIRRFKELGRKSEAQVIRFIDQPWQSYVYHDMPIFASIVRPADPLAAVHILEKLIATKPLQFAVKGPASDQFGPYSVEFIRSQPMQYAVSQLQRLKQLPVDTVLIGPTGAGKDTAARWLHAQSGVKGEFIHVNCAALPEQLFEAEVFGVMAGAFTGAHGERRGKFELANGGTLFLDEVGELPLTVQAKLLRVLQSGQLQRLGSDKEHQVDVRLIAATNRDLAEEVRSGRYRADFYHRLSVYPLQVPALRERAEDIALLAEALLARVAPERRRNLSAGALRRLAEHAEVVRFRAAAGEHDRMRHRPEHRRHAVALPETAVLP